jgi:hypothetical protein
VASSIQTEISLRVRYPPDSLEILPILYRMKQIVNNVGWNLFLWTIMERELGGRIERDNWFCSHILKFDGVDWWAFWPNLMIFVLGIGLIDTASIYKNEVEIGEAVRDANIKRDELFICSKVSPFEHG